MTVFSHVDASNNLRHPRVNVSDDLRVDGSNYTQPISAASLPLPTGASTSANQVTTNTRIGDLTETAPATDTASSGLNGRLQRVAQRLTSIFTSLSDGTQKSRITNGTVDAQVTNAQPLRADQGLVVRSLPYYPPTFSVVFPAIALANNKSLLAIQNTSTSTVRIRKIYLVNTRAAAATGVVVDYRLLRIESFTGGTAVTIHKMDTPDTLPSGITAATGATVASESSLYRQSFWSSDEWGPGSLDTEGSDHSVQELIPWYKVDSYEKPITLIQNQGVHIRCATNTTAGEVTITVVFTVES
jgi:hypothetical protein